MRIEFKESFAKDLSKIDARTLQKVKRIIEKLEQAESLKSISHVKKLKSSLQCYYRIRLDDYRMGFKLENDKITLIRFFTSKRNVSLFSLEFRFQS